MNDLPSILAGLKSDSAKQRERNIKALTPATLADPQIIEQLQTLVSADPVEYVRVAAREQLVAAGQTARESLVPVQLKQEGAGKPAAFAIGCFVVVAICVLVAIIVIAVLAILGPQIGNIFSRVTNGLGS